MAKIKRGDPENLGAEAPSAFPRWMRRFDPSLRRAETNPVYQAYQRRRTLYGHGRTLTTRALLSLLPTAFFVFQIWIMNRRGSNQWIFTGVMLLVVLSNLIQWLRTGRSSHSGAGLGPGPLHLIAPSNINREALYELWSTGVRGRELAEAIALEARGQGLVGVPVLVIITASAISAAIIEVNLFGAWKHLVIAALGLFFLHAYYVSLFCGPSTGAASLRNALKILESAAANSRWFAGLGTLARGVAIGLVVVFIVVLGVVPLVVSVVSFLGRTSRGGGTLAVTQAVIPILIVAVLASIASVLHALRKRMWRSGVRTLVREYRRADVAFDRYVRKVIIGDPDVK